MNGMYGIDRYLVTPLQGWICNLPFPMALPFPRALPWAIMLSTFGAGKRRDQRPGNPGGLLPTSTRVFDWDSGRLFTEACGFRAQGLTPLGVFFDRIHLADTCFHVFRGNEAFHLEVFELNFLCHQLLLKSNLSQFSRNSSNLSTGDYRYQNRTPGSKTIKTNEFRVSGKST